MTNLELKTAVRDELSIASSSDLFFSDAYIQRIVNRAVKYAGSLYNWQQTQDARKRDSVAGQEYYNYPENWKTDSVFKVKFNGERYDPTNFDEYEQYQEENGASANDKIFADYKRQVFLNPVPTTVAEITVWGHAIPDAMSGDSDTHPFAGEAEIEEAIILYAQGLAKKKARGSYYAMGVQDIKDAEKKFKEEYDKQLEKQSHYQNKDLEIFEWVDMLPCAGNNTRTRRGSFETCTC